MFKYSCSLCVDYLRHEKACYAWLPMHSSMIHLACYRPGSLRAAGYQRRVIDREMYWSVRMIWNQFVWHIVMGCGVFKKTPGPMLPGRRLGDTVMPCTLWSACISHTSCDRVDAPEQWVQPGIMFLVLRLLTVFCNHGNLYVVQWIEVRVSTG